MAKRRQRLSDQIEMRKAALQMMANKAAIEEWYRSVQVTVDDIPRTPASTPVSDAFGGLPLWPLPELPAAQVEWVE